MKNFIVTAALLASAAVAQASPVQYNFAYSTGIGLLSGTLMGELQADHNTIVISSLLDFAKFNGVAGPSLPLVTSIYTLLTGGQTLIPATTTLDGSVQDFYALDRNLGAPGEPDGFALISGLTGLPFNWYGAGASFGNTAGSAPLTYVAANWSIQSAAAVPEPASLLLVGLGLAGMAASRRRAQA